MPYLTKDLSVSCWSVQQVAFAAGATVMTAAVAAALISSLNTALTMKGRWAGRGLVSDKHLKKEIKIFKCTT